MIVIPNPAAHELVSLLTAVRPDWQPAEIERAVYDPTCKTRGFTRTAWAFLWVALDPSSHSPRRALAPGPWWDTPNRPANSRPRRYVPEQPPAPCSEQTRQLIEETRKALQRRSTSVIVNTDAHS